MCCLFFFFKQKTAYEMRISDWSSDVCSSDLQSASSTNLTTRSSAAARVPAMKIDGGLGGDLRNAGKAAASQEAQGYDGVWTAETSHDPLRSETRRVGKECVSSGRSRGSPYQ